MKERGNGLLTALPAGELARITSRLEEVRMPLGWVVYEAGAEQRYVYFPTTGIVSLLYVMADGHSAEIAVWAMKALSVLPCSWVAGPRQAVPSCKARATPTDWARRR
jgi:hypothetical protein